SLGGTGDLLKKTPARCRRYESLPQFSQRLWLADNRAHSYAFHRLNMPGEAWHKIMALENCSLCRGTGWKLVPRADGLRGNVAVACDCGMEERAGRVMERARIPKRYEHCDFESFVTDLADGKIWTAQHSQSLKQANLLTQAFVRDYPGSAEKGLLLIGPSGIGKTHLAVASLKGLLGGGQGGGLWDFS